MFRGLLSAWLTCAAFVCFGATGTKGEPPAWSLKNAQVTFEFTQLGLLRATDRKTGLAVTFRDLGASIALAGESIDTADMLPTTVDVKQNDIAYEYAMPQADVQIVFELKPGRRFLSKRILISPKTSSEVRIGKIEPFRVAFLGPTFRAMDVPNVAGPRFLRLSASAGFKVGMFLVLQNPFLEATLTDQRIAASYTPDMAWQAAYGKFASDWFCIGFNDLTGDVISAPAIDRGEWSAVRACEREFIGDPHEKPLKAHIASGDNESLLSTTRAADLSPYEREIDRAAEFGCDVVLFSPARPLVDSEGATASHTALGDVGFGPWPAGSQEVPPTVQALLDYAQSKKVKLPITVYPLMSDRKDADIGLRSFQDALVSEIGALVKKTGVGGVRLDYTRARAEAATSSYARWDGSRRVLALLREALPGLVVEQIRQDAFFSAASEATTDIPDLHVDRIAAFRQRSSAYSQAIEGYAPPELIAGCATHRPESVGGASGNRDWDLLGWRYSLLSAVATAPFSLTVGAIPARDLEEFKALSEADKSWFHEWLNWPGAHQVYARNARPIIGPPMLGKVDGTSMIVGDRGYIFLFNPNYRRLNADFRLDDSIGLSKGRRWMLRQISPGPGVWVLCPGADAWSRGNDVSLPMAGTSAVVLQIEPVHDVKPLTVIGVGGSAHLAAGVLEVDDVEGEPGSRVEMAVVVPHKEDVSKLIVNGKIEDFKRERDLIVATLQFKDRYFSHAKGLSVYSPTFTGKALRSEFVVPKSVFLQLAARKKAWPVTYTTDDLQRPWLGSNRLLLFFDIAEADENMKIAVTIDEDSLELSKAYRLSADGSHRLFVGFYGDVSDVDPEERHIILAKLPELKPGRFQGVFFENVENDATDEIYAKGEMPPRAPGEGD